MMRRLFSSTYRKARRAEGRGEYRDAAALYAEADMPEEAANALLFHAARATDLEERLDAYHDALRWLPEGHPRRAEVDGQIGLAILGEAQRRGAHTAEERRRLEDAAARLERAEKHSEAANAYELLERTDDVARNLQLAGEVEKLEALLDETTREAREERALRSAIADYEMATAVGARLEAREALLKALDLAPDNRDVAQLLRRLDERLLRGNSLRLRVNEQEMSFVGGDALVLGRDADFVVRGASVSRRHTEVRVQDGKVTVRDLGSRNGTLVRGVPIAGEMTLDGMTEIGLGDDVEVRLEPQGTGLRLEVLRGLDRGVVALLGAGELAIPGVRASVSFGGGHPTLTPRVMVQLGRQSVAAPIVLLREDVIEIQGARVEVP